MNKKNNIKSTYLFIIAVICYLVGFIFSGIVCIIILCCGLFILSVALKIKAQEIAVLKLTKWRYFFQITYMLFIAASCYITSWLIGGFIGDLIGTIALVALISGIIIAIKENKKIKSKLSVK
jgi:hypothetical protein